MKSLRRVIGRGDRAPSDTGTSEATDEPCRHPNRQPLEGALEWDCLNCGYTQPRIPEQRDERWAARLAAAHTFHEKYERRNPVAARRRREAALKAARARGRY